MLSLNGNVGMGVTGDAATIYFSQLSTGGSGANVFTLTADASGVSTIGSQYNMVLGGNDTLNIDVSSYDFGTYGNSLVLFDAGGTFTGTFDTVNVIGGSGDLSYNGATGQVILQNIIPEPATVGMLALGVLITTFIRRFQTC